MKQRRLAALLLCAALIMCMVPVCYAAVTVGPGDTGENVKKIQRRLIRLRHDDCVQAFFVQGRTRVCCF